MSGCLKAFATRGKPSLSESFEPRQRFRAFTPTYFARFHRTLFQINKEERSMSETSTLIGYGGRTIGREELALVPTPVATETHRPVPHHEIVQALVETLGFRHIGVVHDEYAVSPDGMKAFGV